MSTATHNWSKVKHGTLNDFVMSRYEAFTGRNLEQFQAAGKELAGMVAQYASDPNYGLCEQSRTSAPVLKKLTRRAIEKYAVSLKIWQLEILTWEELEAFTQTVFVWR